MTHSRLRRRAVLGACAAIPAALVAGCAQSASQTGAVEDLMREHGVLRRAFLVYQECVGRLRAGVALDAAALHETAALFRAFGEDYHERKLEEAFIFPALRKTSGQLETLVDTLKTQHERGRDVTDYVLRVTRGASIAVADAEPLARAFQFFAMMYANHTAREDTILFPAWKQTLSPDALDEIGERFEDIEKQEFGRDGFAEAVRRIGRVEEALGLSDLAQFTAPQPPRG
ncbi:MAG TPA: hemerythrin domain-containing protein [Rhizomicrobium sp.]|jgi:hemerythrin-like domain-containing protein|nr:hemerythrin domain-containing protein [Rhizomicrobium sp.]